MKDFTKLSLMLFYLIITSIFAKHPNHYSHNDKFTTRNNNITFQYNGKDFKHDYNLGYNYKYKDYEFKGFINEYTTSFSVMTGAFLFSIWSALFVLYFLVNRRKNTFTVILPKQNNNLSCYMNI